MKIKLQYITQGGESEIILEEVQKALSSGIQWIQLRIKSDKLDVLSIAQRIKKQCQGGSALFLINDRVDVAKAVDADGVHLGLDDMAIREARHILGKNKIIGGTANTLSDCISRVKDGVDYIGLGPYRYTATKERLSKLLGLQGYKTILNDERIKVPVYAVGGIRLEDIKKLKMQTNVWGVAVSSLFKESEDKKRLVKQIKYILQDG